MATEEIVVCNANADEINVQVIGDKLVLNSESKGGTGGFGIAGVDIQAGGNLQREYDTTYISKIADSFTIIASGNKMSFFTTTDNALITIRLKDGTVVCNKKEVKKNDSFIITEKGALIQGQKKIKRLWFDLEGKNHKPIEKKSTEDVCDGQKTSTNSDNETMPITVHNDGNFLKPIPETLSGAVDISDTSDDISSEAVEINERRVLVIGKTGVGKSITANTILGENEFDCKLAAKSITKKSGFGISKGRWGRKLVIVDTPGLCDTNTAFRNEDVLEEINRYYGMTSPGLHAVILVVSVGRFGKEDEETVNLFKKHFGGELMAYLIVVFAGRDTLEFQDTDIKDFIETYEDGSGMKGLLKDINNRYVVFGHRKKHDTDKTDREREVKELLDIIDDLVKQNGNRIFSNPEFQKAEKKIKKEIDIRLKHKKPTSGGLLKKMFWGSKTNEPETARNVSSEVHGEITKAEFGEETQQEIDNETRREKQAAEDRSKLHMAYDDIKKQEESLDEMRIKLAEMESARNHASTRAETLIESIERNERIRAETLMFKIRDEIRYDIHKRKSGCEIQ